MPQPDVNISQGESSGIKRRRQSQESKPLKRRKWSNTYTRYGFFVPKDQEGKDYPDVQCILCPIRIGNNNLAPCHLSSHLKKHPEQVNKSEEFFASMVSSHKSQGENFEKQVRIDDVYSQASFQMAHVLLKNKCSFTLMEKVIMPCLVIAAKLLFGGNDAVQKV